MEAFSFYVPFLDSGVGRGWGKRTGGIFAPWSEHCGRLDLIAVAAIVSTDSLLSPFSCLTSWACGGINRKSFFTLSPLAFFSFPFSSKSLCLSGLRVEAPGGGGGGGGFDLHGLRLAVLPCSQPDN